MTAEQRTYRYMGVRPFGAADRDLFFGRDDDIESLCNLILSEKLVVLFGKSGYGKSSLLNAGVIPRFTDFELYQPTIIEIRFGTYIEGQTASPVSAILAKLKEKRSEPSLSVDQNDTLLETYYSDVADRPMWYHFKKRQHSSGVGFLLIFDQFEEFFSYPAFMRENFKTELAELLYSDIPQYLRKRITEASQEDKRLLVEPMDVKTIFSIRADRISHLDSMKDALPAILHKRYELRSLTRSQAREAIVKPASIRNDQFSVPPFEYTEEGLTAMLNALTVPISGHNIYSAAGGVEAFQLQILCEHIESLVRNGKVADCNENGLPEITPDDLPEMENLYETYYRRKLSELDPTKQRAAQLVLEDGLLAEDSATGEGRRMSVDSRALLAQFVYSGLNRELLEDLENTFLIRREVNTVGGFSYEVSHDTLAGPIMKARKERKAEEEQLASIHRQQVAEENAKAEKNKRLEAERQKRQALLLTVATAVGLVVAIWFYFNAKKATERAENAQREAEKQTIIAIKQTALAEAEKLRSDRMLDEVLKQKGLTRKALEESKEKELARMQAVELRKQEGIKNLNDRVSDIKTLLNVGDKAEALKRLNEMLEIAPNHPQLIELKKQLQ